MKRKMISTVLAGLMAAGLLAGCGSTASSSTAAKSNSVETGSTAVASASGQSGSGKYAGETITMMVDTDTMSGNNAIQAVIDSAEKKFGFKVVNARKTFAIPI